MTLRNQVLIWIVIFTIGVVTLWIFRSILLPFIIGMALAYILNPAVRGLERLHFSRGWATATVLLVVLAVIVGLFLAFVPLAIQQVIGLVQRLPSYIVELRELVNQLLPALNEWLGPERAAEFERSVDELLASLPGWTAAITAQIAQSSASVLSVFGLMIFTPVVAFYLLLDWDSMQRGLDELLPLDYRGEIRGVLADIDRSMSGVFRGQGGVILVLCFYYATALTLVGLNFGLGIGLIAGLFSFVPYVGFATGLVLSMGIAMVQFWPNWIMIAVVFIIYMVGQFLEGNVLYPKLVGSSIGINPVWLMFALFAFALLFGFVGLLLAVPLSAIANVLTKFAIRKYKESALYTGRNGSGGGDISTV